METLTKLHQDPVTWLRMMTFMVIGDIISLFMVGYFFITWEQSVSDWWLLGFIGVPYFTWTIWRWIQGPDIRIGKGMLSDK